MIKKWDIIVDTCDIAFQPIVDIKTGKTVAYESLLREYDVCGFSSINDFFDSAFNDKALYQVDLKLRDKVLKKIRPIYKSKNFKLFYNLDNRIIQMDDYENGHTKKMISSMGFDNDFLVYEISEKHKLSTRIDIQTLFQTYSAQGFKIAIDDFGTGYSGLKMLYHLEPSYIKIDRFFISDILKHEKKRNFLKHIVSLAHKENIIVLAEGIETKDELKVCQEIGCDLAQGYYIQKPTCHISELKSHYKHIYNMSQVNFQGFIDCETVENDLLSMVTHDLKSPMTAIFGSFDMLNIDNLSQKEKEESIKIGKKASRSVVSLIESILTMAKFQAGKLPIVPKEVTSLKNLFKEIYNTFKYETSIKNIKFTMNIEPKLPKVFWDIDKIHFHVINNIISNSIKYTPVNGKIALKCHQVKNNILIEIKDNGVGIKKEDQKEIFNKYKTSDGQKLLKGKGLGLYNASSFVTMHNGTINITKGIDQKGVGFKITLPIGVMPKP